MNVKEPKANGGIGDGHYWMRYNCLKSRRQCLNDDFVKKAAFLRGSDGNACEHTSTN